MDRSKLAISTVAQSYLRLLKQRGVDYLFANAGTDFASIIEAYAALGGKGVPKPVTVPHENAPEVTVGASVLMEPVFLLMQASRS